MVGAVLGIVLTLVVLGVILYVVQEGLNRFPMPEPIRFLIWACILVLGVVIVVWVLIQLLGVAGIHVVMPAFH